MALGVVPQEGQRSFGALPILTRKLFGSGKIRSQSGAGRVQNGKDQGGFLSRHPQGLILQDYVIWKGADRPSDCVGVEGADGFFVGIGGTAPSTM